VVLERELGLVGEYFAKYADEDTDWIQDADVDATEIQNIIQTDVMHKNWD